MEYNKLVRDRIPEIIKGKGETPVTHVAEEVEYKAALLKKLQEEVDEFRQQPSAEEAADILEVIHAICDELGIDKTSIEPIRIKKAEERGAFKSRIILDRTEK
ncbi:MAG: nucleoside triphosphate pyrophosphohydrolase [Patescibacteria group bacterium]